MTYHRKLIFSSCNGAYRRIVQTILILLMQIVFLSKNPLMGQDLIWKIYYEFGYNLNDVAIEDSILWINAGWSLIKFNLASGDTTIFEMNDFIRTIEIDRHGNKWSGLDYKLAKFNDSVFTFYDLRDYGFEGEFFGVTCITFDDHDNLWFGVDSGGVGLYDGNSLMVMNRLDHLAVTDIAVDKNDIKWIGTVAGIEKYDNQNWYHYDASNSGFPGYNVNAVAVDSSNNKLFGSDQGLAIYNDTTWVVYDSGNSDLPNDIIYFIYVDSENTIWISCDFGNLVAIKGNNWIIYNPSSNYGNINSMVKDCHSDIWFTTSEGVLFSNSDIAVKIQNPPYSRPIIAEYNLYQNYPNPFNRETGIQYELLKASNIKVEIFNLLGQRVKILINEVMQSGLNSVIWNGRNESNELVPSGIYIYQIAGSHFKKNNKLILLR